MAVDGDDRGFLDGWVVVGVHARARASDAWVGKAVGAEGGVFGWGVGGAGERGSASDLQRSGVCAGRDGEVARVDGFARVVEGGGVGGPVGEGWFCLDLFGAGEGDLPVGAEVDEMSRSRRMHDGTECSWCRRRRRWRIRKGRE